MLRFVGLTVAAALAMAAPAAGAGFTFDRAMGFVNPAPFDCTTASGCVTGAPGSLAGQLQSPSGSVVVGTEIFVADTENNRISVYTAATGAFVRAFGKNVGGSGVGTCTTTCRSGNASGDDGAFNRPSGIATDGTDLYVADTSNNRIEVLTTAGVFERFIGEGGNASGQLSQPTALAVSGGKVYVADADNQRIDVFTTAGVFERALGFDDPQVLNCTTNCFSGAPLSMSAGISNPSGTAVSGGEVYVADPGNNRIDVFTTAGVFVRAFGRNVDGAGGNTCTTSCQQGYGGDERGRISNPRGIAIAGGEVFIATEYRRIDVFTTAGEFVRAFGKSVNADDDSDVCTTSCRSGQDGDAAGQLRDLQGIAVSGGKVYVTEAGNQRVSVFTTAGVFERAFGKDVGGAGVRVCTTTCEGGHSGSDAGDFYYPFGITVDGGEVYVSDFYNSRIDVFSTSGVFARTIGRNVDGLGGDVCVSSCKNGDYSDGGLAREIQNPHGIAVSGGTIYVADLYNSRIAMWTTAGVFQGAFGKDVGGSGVDTCTTVCQTANRGGGVGQLRYPAGLALDSGKLYIADQQNHRVTVFDTAGAFVRAFGARLAPNCTTNCTYGFGGGDAGQLNRPSGVAVTGGNVFVAENDNRRVSVFDAGTGAFVRAWGKDVGGTGVDTCTTTCQEGRDGDGPGDLYRPSGVATDGTNLYVTERYQARVSVFTAATGAFVQAFGKDVGGSGIDTCTTTCQGASGGGGAGQLNEPVGPAVAGGKVYVTDRGNHRISVFDAATGAFSHAFGLTLTARCTTVCGTGAYGGAAGQLAAPQGAAVSGGEVFVADRDNSRISVFDAATGEFVRAFGKNVDGSGGNTCTTSCQAGQAGGAAGQLSYPSAVAIAGDELYVADYYNSRIDVFTTEGEFLRAFAKGVNTDDNSDICTTSCRGADWGTAAGQLREPSGITVSGGQVYVAEAANQRVSVFTTAGVFERVIGKNVDGAGGSTCTSGCQAGQAGNGEGQFYYPFGIAVAGGEIFVSDFYNSRVDVFTTAGTFVRMFGRNVDGDGGEVCTSDCRNGDYGGGDVGEIQNPYGILVDGGKVYVADLANQRIAVFTTAGDFAYASGKDVGGDGVDICTDTCQSGTRGGGAGELMEPAGIALSGGNLFVAEQSNNRVSKFGTGAFSSDNEAPVTTDDVPSSGYSGSPVTVTLSASDTGGAGLNRTYYTTGANPPRPTTSSLRYNPNAKPTLADGEKIRYFSTDFAGNLESPHTSSAAHVDTDAPATTDDVPASGPGSATVTLSPSDSGSGVDKTYYTTGTIPALPTLSSTVYNPSSKPKLHDGERIRYFSTDLAGNAETPNLSNVVHLPTADASSSSLTFGAVGSPVSQGTVSPSQSVTLTNNGSSSLLVTGFAFSGTNGDDFLIGSDTCRGLIPTGGTCAFTVRFAPQGQGSRSATVTVLTNAFAFTTVTLTGTGGLIVGTGATGATGPTGPPGADGRTILSGTGAPSSGLGSNGDYYLDTAANRLYGPKTTGVWGPGVSLTGPAGADGRTILSGTGAPSSGLGSNGDYYLDTAASRLYGPKSAGAWGSGVVLIGPIGTTGPSGATGAKGDTGAKGANGATGAKGDKGDIGDTGPQGPAGKSSRCVVLKTSSGKQKINCSQIRTTRAVVSMRLSRGRTVYASGRGRTLRARRAIRPGRYLLTIVTSQHGRRVVTRRKVTI